MREAKWPNTRSKVALKGPPSEKRKYMDVIKHYVGDGRDRETSFGMWGSLDDIQLTDDENVEIELMVLMDGTAN